MVTLLSLLLVLLLASPVVAQPRAHDPSLYPKGCAVTSHGEGDTRVECDVHGEKAALGYKHGKDGPEELTKGRSWKTLGLVPTWHSKKLGPQPAPDGEPIVPPETAETATLDTVPAGYAQIDACIFWTLKAQNEQGGIAAISALAVASVANMNEALEQSQIPARVRLRYLRRAYYIESRPTLDLSRFFLTSDGHLDELHTYRTQYGCDVMTLLGAGWSAQGACGVGYNPSTPNAIFAFTVVDRSCAAGYLSYAHEVAHNMSAKHDPANAGCGTNCTGSNYGHNTSTFRTVMSYGGQPRIRRFSTPLLTYNGVPLGIAGKRDNAQALRNHAARVANFLPEVAGEPEIPLPAPPPPCLFTVSPMTLAFPAAGGSRTVQVTTTSLCGWSSAAYVGWTTVTGAGRGSGTATITVAPNAGAARTAEVRVSSQRVAVSQAGQE